MFETLVPLTLVLARAYGVGIIVVALAALLAPARTQAALGDFQRSPGLTFLASLFALALSLFLVILHSIWVDFPAIFVSLFGWAVLVKGVLLLATPEVLMKFAARVSGSLTVVRTWGVIALMLGVVYLVIGFSGRALAGL